MPNILDEITQETQKEFQTEKAKYEPIVPRLTDIGFAALYTVVMEERSRRMTRLMMENPAIMQMELDRLSKQLGEQGL